MQLSMPLVGLGTYELIGEVCTRAVKNALEIGYRHIDTAHLYENHTAIAKAIADFPRDQLFLTSKLALGQLDKLSVAEACHLALTELGVDYLDLYLVHWPDRKRPMGTILQEMAELVQQGKVRHIGGSNFTIHHLQDALDLKIPLVANQVEFHPYLYQKELLKLCNEKKIQLISYRSFGKGALLKDPLFREIGQKHGKTSAQVVLRWTVQKGIPVIPRSSSETHLRENFDLFDFTLTGDEMQQIDQCDRGQRFCAPDVADFSY
jgi:2,5-diketo-D-gluconate reductase B